MNILKISGEERDDGYVYEILCWFLESKLRGASTGTQLLDYINKNRERSSTGEEFEDIELDDVIDELTSILEDAYNKQVEKDKDMAINVCLERL